MLFRSGNVAFALGQAMAGVGITIVQVYSRTYGRATALAEHLGAAALRQLDRAEPDVDMVLVAVPDDEIAGVGRQLATSPLRAALVVHTSGATPVAALAAHLDRAGIFYLPQTMSASQLPDFSTVPLCYDATTAQDRAAVAALGRKMGFEQMRHLVDAQRRSLHLAAVFANNFTNHCLYLSQRILAQAELPEAMLAPLIKATFDKVTYMPAREAQTGPARRGDRDTLAAHEQLLQHTPELIDMLEVYRRLSHSILKSYP